MDDPGAVHEDVEPAEPPRQILEHRADRALVGDVADERDMPGPVRMWLQGRERLLRFTDVGAGHARAGGREGPCAGGADAAMGAGDEDEAVLQLVHAITSPRSSM